MQIQLLKCALLLLANRSYNQSLTDSQYRFFAHQKAPHLFLLCYSLVSLKLNSESPWYANLSAVGYCSPQRAQRKINYKRKPSHQTRSSVKAAASLHLTGMVLLPEIQNLSLNDRTKNLV